MDPIKLAAGTGAGALIAAGGGYLTYSSLYGLHLPTVLAELSNLNTVYSDAESFGRKNSLYLVDPDSNQWWWKEKYEAFKRDVTGDAKDKLGETFKDTTKVASSFGSEATALNTICKTAFTGKENALSSEDKKESNVWTYCSLLEGKPILVSSSNYSDKRGNSHKDKAVAIDVKNDIFWNLRNDEFFGRRKEIYKGELATQNSKFRELFYKKKKEKDDTIKKVCEDAYESETSDNSNYPEADIKRFCYLSPEQ
ncbi:hypothetical protein MHSWG343_08020 [Candidatus Mycoplasma haematohominis]|uniref:Uncharacterized protein n=1 Tax=Candidatus Mycoplasma haematohominis TaxID=1494318 RepID=A0A478FUK9_9MOLU|nr:hypothetical protein MHSWG343_08020 [Candidatus Mycoplasma haemohominis]